MLKAARANGWIMFTASCTEPVALRRSMSICSVWFSLNCGMARDASVAACIISARSAGAIFIVFSRVCVFWNSIASPTLSLSPFSIFMAAQSDAMPLRLSASVFTWAFVACAAAPAACMCPAPACSPVPAVCAAAPRPAKPCVAAVTCPVVAASALFRAPRPAVNAWMPAELAAAVPIDASDAETA
jgi:hypothetical protein